jgi:hypothetical protein
MKRTTLMKLGSAVVTYESDCYDGEYFDTAVSINGEHVCVIQGSRIWEFNDALAQIINQYWL